MPVRLGNVPFSDVVLATALTVLVAPVSFLAQAHQPQAGNTRLDAIAVVLMVAASAVLVLRRRYPVAVLAAVFALILTYFSLGYPNGPVWLTMIIAFVGATFAGKRLAAVVVGVIGFGAIPWFGYLIRHQKPPSIGGVLGVAAWVIVLFGVGEVVRIRRERSVAAARIRAEEARVRATEERLRMARELHDSLGHYLSLISVQSAVALNLNADLPEQARSALVAVKDASREGLRELRSALDVLRTDGEPVPRSPTLTLARLSELVARTSAAGLSVRAETLGQARPLPFSVDVAAYRIVQEALTNVTRHAGPATADVTVRYEGDRCDRPGRR